LQRMSEPMIRASNQKSKNEDQNNSVSKSSASQPNLY
jgi:hypothetical protein